MLVEDLYGEAKKLHNDNRKAEVMTKINQKEESVFNAKNNLKAEESKLERQQEKLKVAKADKKVDDVKYCTRRIFQISHSIEELKMVLVDEEEIFDNFLKQSVRNIHEDIEKKAK